MSTATKHALTKGGKIGIIFNCQTRPEGFAQHWYQTALIFTGQVWGKEQVIASSIIDTGGTNHGMYYLRRVDACSIHSAMSNLYGQIDQGRDALRQIGFLTTSDNGAGEIGHRDTHPATANIDADDITGGGVRFIEDGLTAT